MSATISGNFNVNGVSFTKWFNTVFQPAHKSQFPNLVNDANFSQVMANLARLTGKPSVVLEEFIGHFGIMYNETGGTFAVLRERGSLQYFFETKLPNGKSKRSYNQAPLNQLAGDQLKAWGLISSAADVAAWNGTVWPANIPANIPANVLAKAVDCDFNRYRGFGFNQLTWRENYVKCVLPYLSKKSLDDYATTAELDAELANNFAAAAGSYYQFTQLYPYLKNAVAQLASANYPPYGKAVSGSDDYANNLYAPRCNALLAAMKTTTITPLSGTVTGGGKTVTATGTLNNTPQKSKYAIDGLNLTKAQIQQLQTKIMNAGNAQAKSLIANNGGADGDWGDNTEKAFQLLGITIDQLMK